MTHAAASGIVLALCRASRVGPRRIAVLHAPTQRTSYLPIVGQAAMTDNDKKIELINAMVALRRYHDTVLLKDLGPNGEVKMASAEVARHLDLVLSIANCAIDDLDAVQEDQRLYPCPIATAASAAGSARPAHSSNAPAPQRTPHSSSARSFGMRQRR